MSATSPQWGTMWEVFHETLARPAADRTAFLRRSCADAEMRAEVAALLAAHDAGRDRFLATPADRETRGPGPADRARLVGRTIGAYRIESELGAGGMGVVYLARDVRLGRRVAVKALPPVLEGDAGALARFQREARLLASLSHPNIATVYGLEEAAEGFFLAMEYVEGETLARRLERGPLPIEDALDVCAQIAAGVEAAHEAGVIHRDLKPANVLITPDRRAVVLDFGIARGDARDAHDDLTGAEPITLAGLIVGTPGYISPEQARGRPVDRRADVFAFGCVLFACLTGRMAFGGGSAGECLAALLEREPDWSALPPRTPRRVRDVLERCLEKDPALRLRHVGDARLELERVLRHRDGNGSAPEVRATRNATRWALAGIAAVASVATALSLFWMLGVSESRSPVRFTLAPPPDASFVAIGANIGGAAISPDGRHVVFVATEADESRLWLRPLDALEARPLAATDGAFYPFWSPDSRHVAFFATGKLKRVPVTGGMPAVIADAPLGRGGSWGEDGTILFTPATGGLVHRVPAEGGAAEPITAHDPGRREVSHSFPQWLPGGRQFLYLARSADADLSAVYVAGVDRPAARRELLATNFNAIYAPARRGGGALLHVHEGRLAARPFDPDRGALGDEVTILADAVEYAGNVGVVQMSASATGAIVYGRAGTAAARLRWIGRNGHPLGDVGPPGDYIAVQIAPDGRRAAVAKIDAGPGTPDVWVQALDEGAATRVTYHPGLDFHPVWSPDGRTLAYASMRAGALNLFFQPATGAGTVEMPLIADRFRQPNDWTADGRWLLYMERETVTSEEDLWALPLTGDRRPIRLTETRHEESHAQASPDGRFVAYRTDAQGRSEIVVQPFPAGDRRWQISTNGGTQPRWRADGRELFYLAADGRLNAVAIERSPDGLVAGPPQPLFPARTVSAARYQFTYDVARDGQRFLVIARDERASAEQLAVLLDWE